MISEQKLLILFVLAATLVWFLIPQDAISYEALSAPVSEGDTYLSPNTSLPTVEPYKLTQSQIRAYLYEVTTANSIDPVVFITTMECESNLYLGAIGDNGTSYGYAQIHLPAHPSVTKLCALDLYCATDYAIPLWKSRPAAWTCYTNIYL